MQEITMTGPNGPMTITISRGSIPEGHVLTITPKPQTEITLEELLKILVDAHVESSFNKVSGIQFANLIFTDLNNLGYKIIKQ